MILARLFGILCFISTSLWARPLDWPPTVAAVMQAREDQANDAYAKSRFSALSRDYLTRFHREPGARPAAGEIALTTTTILLPDHSSELVTNMASALRAFLNDRMGVPTRITGERGAIDRYMIQLQVSGEKDTPTRVVVDERQLTIAASDDEGVRDGVVNLIDRMGLRTAPFLTQGTAVLRPRVEERIGAVPWLGSMRDVALMGFNAVLLKPYADLHEISTSSVFPEIAYLQNPQSLARYRELAREARRWGLHPYIHVNNRTRFASDHPLFKAHPGALGVKVQAGDGYILSTNDPSVQRYLETTVVGLFRAVPDLAGLIIIVGGEGFYHCYMHPQGFPKGETDVQHCGALGADETVAKLVNTMTNAARSVRPDARVIAWPYSAQYVWSRDAYQSSLIRLMTSAAALQTEVINGAMVRGDDGIETSYWDYSLGAIGPSERALKQIRLAHQFGHAVYVEAEPELSLDFGGLPFLPSPPRWLARANAVAQSGADGVMAAPYFSEFYASLGAEIQKFAWLGTTGDEQDVVGAFARRVAGAGSRDLKKAWDLVGEAISLSPEVPTYFSGPQFLGPAHPLMLDPNTVVPQVYAGQFLYLAESSEGQALHFTNDVVRRTPEIRNIFKLEDDGEVYAYAPTSNTIESFLRRYQRIERLTKQAIDAFDTAMRQAPETSRLILESELSVLEWFWRTARSTANFYEAYLLRECATKPENEFQQRSTCYDRLLQIVDDERQNAMSALVVVQNDPRLDVYYHPFLALSHTEDMIREKIRMLDHDRSDYLPTIMPR